MDYDLVYIIGLAHSGSTVLELILGGHPSMVGIGEVSQAIGPKGALIKAGKIRCSCGLDTGACPFWSQAAEVLHSDPDQYSVYDELLGVFHRIYGHQITPIDSSKTIAHLDALRRRGLRIKVVFVVKDVRSFAVSQLDTRQRNRALGRAPEARLLARIGTRSAWRQFIYWHLKNREIQRYLVQNHVDHIQIAYESLALCPEPTTRRLCAFLGIEYTPVMLQIGDCRSHSVMGNRMTTQPHKRAGIAYDFRWFSDRRWITASCFLPWIMRYNSREVYGADSGMDRWNT